jgi:O-antigen ligase
MQLGIGALALLAVIAWATGTPVIRRTPLDPVLALCAATFVLSTLASGHPVAAAAGWLHVWVVLAYFAIYWWLPDGDGAVRFARHLVAAASVAALYGIVQHYTGIDWYRGLLGREQIVRPRIEGAQGYASVGFFRLYITYGHVLVIPLGFALAAAGGWQRVAAVPLMALALLCSTARGAWVAAAAMVGTLAVTTRGAAKLFAVVAGVLVVAWMVSPGIREQVIPAVTLEETNAGRIAIFEANLDIIHDHPLLGLGFGRYRWAAGPYYDRRPSADRRSHAHNNFLQIAAEAGLIGLAAFTLVFATALRFGDEAVRGARDPTTRAVARGACLATIGFLVGGLTQYTFGDTEVATAMWAALAVLMCLRDAV